MPKKKGRPHEGAAVRIYGSYGKKRSWRVVLPGDKSDGPNRWYQDIDALAKFLKEYYGIK